MNIPGTGDYMIEVHNKSHKVAHTGLSDAVHKSILTPGNRPLRPPRGFPLSTGFCGKASTKVNRLDASQLPLWPGNNHGVLVYDTGTKSRAQKTAHTGLNKAVMPYSRVSSFTQAAYFASGNPRNA